MKYGVKYIARNGDRTVERAVHLEFDEHVEVALDLTDEDACDDLFDSGDDYDAGNEDAIAVEWRNLLRWALVLNDLYRLGLDVTIEEY